MFTYLLTYLQYISEFKSYVKVEAAVLGFPSNEPYCFCGRKATDTEPCFGIGHSLSVPNMSTDIRGHEALHRHRHHHPTYIRAKELCQ